MAEKLPGSVRKKQIGDAALAISAESGVRAVTVASVAERVGIAPSAVYRHVEGREGILASAMDRLSEILRESLDIAAAESDNPLDTLERYLFIVAEHVLTGPASPRILFSDEIFSGTSEKPSGALKFFQELQARQVALFVEGQRAGLIRADIEPRRLGIMFVGLYSPPIIMFHASGRKFDIMDQIHSNWKVFRQAMAPENADPGDRSGLRPGGDVPAT